MVRVYWAVVERESFRIRRPEYLGILRLRTADFQVLIKIHNNFCGAGLYHLRQAFTIVVANAFVFPFLIWRSRTRRRRSLLSTDGKQDCSQAGKGQRDGSLIHMY